MSEISRQSANQVTLFGSTTSPASVDGNTRSDSLDGPKTEKSGPAPVPVSRSQRRVKGAVWKTKDTYGPLFSGSSPSASLQSSLESRLTRRFNLAGSMEYSIRWKPLDTPAGRRLLAQQVSGRRTSGKDFTGWPTPKHEDSEQPGTMGGAAGAHRGKPDTLNAAAKLAGWPSPNWHDGRRPAPDLKSTQGANLSRDAVLLAGWNSPRATDGSKGGPNQSGGALSHDVQMAGWPSPRAEKWGPPDSHGKVATPSTARTVNGGGYRLNPAFSLWLMMGDSVTRELIRTCPRGLVPLKPRATRSASRSRRNS